MIGTADGSTKRPKRFGRLSVMVRARQCESSTDGVGRGSRGGREWLDEPAALGFASDTDSSLRDLAHAQ
jgi:hypothetical protein